MSKSHWTLKIKKPSVPEIRVPEKTINIILSVVGILFFGFLCFGLGQVTEASRSLKDKYVAKDVRKTEIVPTPRPTETPIPQELQDQYTALESERMADEHYFDKDPGLAVAYIESKNLNVSDIDWEIKSIQKIEDKRHLKNEENDTSDCVDCDFNDMHVVSEKVRTLCAISQGDADLSDGIVSRRCEAAATLRNRYKFFDWAYQVATLWGQGKKQEASKLYFSKLDSMNEYHLYSLNWDNAASACNYYLESMFHTGYSIHDLAFQVSKSGGNVVEHFTEDMTDSQREKEINRIQKAYSKKKTFPEVVKFLKLSKISEHDN